MPRRQRHRRRRTDSEKQGSRESQRLGAGRILPLRAPFATTVWDYINRGMPLNREGTLTPDEVYGLTAYLLFINGVIPEDLVLDQQNLAAVKMPLGDNYAPLPDWKPRTPRLKGYPY
jgi:cytochrome c